MLLLAPAASAAVCAGCPCRCWCLSVHVKYTCAVSLRLRQRICGRRAAGAAGVGRLGRPAGQRGAGVEPGLPQAGRLHPEPGACAACLGHQLQLAHRTSLVFEVGLRARPEGVQHANMLRAAGCRPSCQRCKPCYLSLALHAAGALQGLVHTLCVCCAGHVHGGVAVQEPGGA